MKHTKHIELCVAFVAPSASAIIEGNAIQSMLEESDEIEFLGSQLIPDMFLIEHVFVVNEKADCLDMVIITDASAEHICDVRQCDKETLSRCERVAYLFENETSAYDFVARLTRGGRLSDMAAFREANFKSLALPN
jgi:hypothetical protein